MTIIDRFIVEPMARTAYAVRSEHYGGFQFSWSEVGTYRRRLYMQEMRAAAGLPFAIGVVVGVVVPPLIFQVILLLAGAQS